MTYEEVREYVRYEARECETRDVGAYESEPYAVVIREDKHGNEVIEDTTCTVRVHLLGDDAHGYILCTSDEADGPTDALGRTVYTTAAAALDAMQDTADILPAGELVCAR